MISQKQIIISGLLVSYYQNEPKQAGDPVVFLHGWRSSAVAFKKVLEILDQKNIKFYALDLPGFGSSDAPRSGSNLDFYVDVVVDFIERSSGKAILVGHSFGGRIAIKLASKRPDLVDKLVLVDSAGIRQESDKLTTKSFLAKLFHPFFKPKFMQGLRRKIYSLIGASDYLATPEFSETFVKVISEDLTAHLSRILRPTLIVWGEDDQETPLSFAATMNEQINGSKLSVMPNCGHFPFLDDPDKFTRIVVEFL